MTFPDRTAWKKAQITGIFRRYLTPEGDAATLQSNTYAFDITFPRVST